MGARINRLHKGIVGASIAIARDQALSIRESDGNGYSYAGLMLGHSQA